MAKPSLKFFSNHASKLFKTSPSNGSRKKTNFMRMNEAAGFAKEHVRKQATRHAKILERDEARHSHLRKDERRDCFVIAEASFPDRGIKLSGVVLEASKNGLTFRPASNYILDRTGEHIQIVMEGMKKTGVIRSTRVNGYGVQLFDRLNPSELKMMRQLSIEISKTASSAA